MPVIRRRTTAAPLRCSQLIFALIARSLIVVARLGIFFTPLFEKERKKEYLLPLSNSISPYLSLFLSLFPSHPAKWVDRQVKLCPLNKPVLPASLAFHCQEGDGEQNVHLIAYSSFFFFHYVWCCAGSHSGKEAGSARRKTRPKTAHLNGLSE
jgi:hypothetical protein